MSNFIHRWLNPHCSHCLAEQQERSICRSCETLQMEIERLRNENERLLNHLLTKPVAELPAIPAETLKPVLPRHISWDVRKQMLESEDRERARILQNKKLNADALYKTPTQQLEKEFGIIQDKETENAIK